MTDRTTTRRVRLCTCPHCGFAFPVKRRSPDEPPGENVQCCSHCFLLIDVAAQPTWLEPLANHPSTDPLQSPSDHNRIQP